MNSSLCATQAASQRLEGVRETIRESALDIADGLNVPEGLAHEEQYEQAQEQEQEQQQASNTLRMLGSFLKSTATSATAAATGAAVAAAAASGSSNNRKVMELAAIRRTRQVSKLPHVNR